MSTENTDRRVATTNNDKGERSVEYMPFGSDTRIKISIATVKSTLATKTRSGHTCTDQDAIKFMMMCQARGLNPYEGDAFLVGYDTKEGDHWVPRFSLITAHQAFLKRAEVHPLFKGMTSGIILLDNEKNETVDREGDFHLPDETVVGGWASVFFYPAEGKTEARMPVKRRLRLSRFNTGRSQWEKDAAGMIVKCAEADALRSSFPTKIGGMYLADEIGMTINVDSTVTEIPMNRLVATTEDVPETSHQAPPQQAPDDQGEAEAPRKAQTATPKANSPQDKLATFCAESQVSFDQFQKWAMESENVNGADSIENFAGVPAADAERLMRAPKAMLHQIRGAKPVEKIEEKGK